jgi:ATP-dependent Clp protease ATP-binding subunit ClpA
VLKLRIDIWCSHIYLEKCGSDSFVLRLAIESSLRCLPTISKASLAAVTKPWTYGARPMRRAVEKYLEDPLAKEFLRGNIKQGDTLEAHAAGQQLVFKVNRQRVIR